MNKAFDAFLWENYPKTDTPLGKTLLNRINTATDAIDDRVIVLDNTKATKVEVSTLIKEVAFDEQTGIITFTRKNGATVVIDTPMEKIQTGIYYNPVSEMLVLPLIDGTSMEVDLSRLMKFDEFIDSDTIAFSVKANGAITAIVKEGSIEEKHLRPDYLSDIRVEVEKAKASATAAENSESAAKTSETNAKRSETNAKSSEDAAAGSATSASGSASTASAKAGEAATSAANAASSATTSAQKAADSATSATNAANSESASAAKASEASASASTAASKATDASNYAKQAQSYAVGTGGVRPNESADNAKYYYEQSRDISQGLTGALMPMGTVAFTNLPSLASAKSGWMYNISDKFTTTSSFKEGAGHGIPAGANVYKTSDGYWDILAGTPVTSVNGHTGNVNITPANIGLGNVANERQYSVSNPQPSVTGSSGSCTGNAATATALTSNAGSAAQPVYFSGGKPVACTAYASASVNYANSAGTATTATKATQDGNGRNIVSTYYPITGGTVNGNVNMPNSRWLTTKNTTAIETFLLGMNTSNSIHIGDYNGANISPVYLHANGVTYNFLQTEFIPASNGHIGLGNSSHLWKNVYAKTGAINTSDRTKKHDIRAISEVYERLFLSLQPKSFMFDDGDRVHIGAISQDVEDAMKELGIAPEQFAGFCKDIRYEYTEFNEEDGTPVEASKVPCTDEDGNLIYDYALRYQEFIFLTIHMTQRLWEKTALLEKENLAIKERVEILEGKTN